MHEQKCEKKISIVNFFLQHFQKIGTKALLKTLQVDNQKNR